MFIKTEQTPNDNVLKFTIVSQDGTIFDNPITFHKIENATTNNILADDLLNINGIVSVFFNQNYVSISKDENTEWFFIKPNILSAIMDYLSNDSQQRDCVIVDNNIDENFDYGSTDDSNETIKKIKDVIKERIAPAVEMDGGGIKFIGFKDGIVFVSLLGACKGCPSSVTTLKVGIEGMLKHYVEDVKSVEDIGS